MSDRTDAEAGLWDLLEEFRFCMLVTHDDSMDATTEQHGGAELRGRPMAAYLDRDEGLIRFLSTRTDHKVEELDEERHCCLTFAQPGDNRFASVSGLASLSTDRATIKDLWGPAADEWFKGDAETADVAVITVRPTHAEYWRKDETAVTRMFEFAKALVTETTPDVGKNEKVDLHAHGGA